jgi:pilus assembly protein CpaB
MTIKSSWAATIALALIALVFGGLAFFGSQRYLAESTAAIEAQWRSRYSPIKVLVASRDLPAGYALQSEDLARRDVPSAFVPAGSIDESNLGQALGRQLLIAVGAGEPISTAQLASQDGRTLAARLQAGTRAMTVPVDDISSQAGLIRPGDRVDLLLAEERTEEAERCVLVSPLMQSLNVIATGQYQHDPQRIDPSRQDPGQRISIREMQYSTLTFDVSPEQAQKLALALRVGELIPMLRAVDDTSAMDLPTVTSGKADCAPGQARPPRAAAGARQRGPSVELLVGGESALSKSRHYFAETP